MLQYQGTDRFSSSSDGLAELQNIMASGEMLPSQTPSGTQWSANKRLAAAVLASALVEVRDHSGNPSYGKRIREDLEWIMSDDTEWPFSFLRLCDLFGLEADWVRERVAFWHRVPPRKRNRPATPYRQAA